MKNILSFKIDQKSYFNIYFFSASTNSRLFYKGIRYMKPLPLA